METIFTMMGASGANRQNPHMHATREKGGKPGQKMPTSIIGKYKQHDQDETKQQKERTRKESNAPMSGIRQKPDRPPQEKQHNRRRVKRNGLRKPRGLTPQGGKEEK